MKKPKDGLFRLIKSMTPAEKRYFKVHFASRKSVLTDLFGFLNARDLYDEEHLKAHFPSQVSRNFKVYKSQLWQLLIKSMTAFYSKRQVVSKIRMGLEEVDLLTEKGLNDLALGQLEKVKRLCLKYEEFTYLIEVARKEYVLSHPSIDKIGLGRSPIYDQIFKSLDHLHNQTRLSQLSNELIDLERQKEFNPEHLEVDKQLEGMLNLPELDQAPSTASFLEKVAGNILRTKIQDALGKQQEGGHWRKANVELFHQFPHFKDTLLFQYLGVLRNFLNFCLVTDNYEDVKNLIKEAEAFCLKNPDQNPQLIYFYYAEVFMLYQRCEFIPLTEEIVPKVLTHLEVHRQTNDRIAVSIYGFMVLTYLAIGDHSRAQEFVRQFQAVKSDIRERYRALFFILEWIIHYDAGDVFLADNHCKAFLRRTDEKLIQADPLLKDMIYFFKQLLNNPTGRVSRSKEMQARIYEYPPKGLIVDFMQYRLAHWFVAVENGLSIAETVRRLETETIKKAPFP